MREVFGLDVNLPIQSYGLMVAIAFLMGVWVLIIELKRKEKQGLLQTSEKKVMVGAPAKAGDLILSGLIGFLIGYKLLDAILRYSAFTENPQDFLLSADGNFIGGLLGAGISIFFLWRDKHKKRIEKPYLDTVKVYPHELAGNILVVAGIFGLLGAKIFHNLENWDELVADPVDALLSFSGLSFLGGLIIGGIAVIWYAKKRNISIIHLADAAAIVLPLSYAVGRLGCQIAGDGCWGVYNSAFADPNTIPMAAIEMGHVASFAPPSWLSFLPDWLWAYNYPHNILNEGTLIPGCQGTGWANCHVLAAPVFPTPLYEFGSMLVVFFILFYLRKKIRIPGMLFVLYFIFAGLERFFVEKIRVNNLYKVGDFEFTQAELISSIMVIAGIVMIILLVKYRKKWMAKFGDSAIKKTA
jgi:prolipoprotein diacylglyceryl transferase